MKAQTAAARLADQLRRAFDGSAWHGPALIELLQDVDAATAAAKPLPEVHSIWELVLHIAVWDSAASRQAGRKKISTQGPGEFSTGVHADRSCMAQDHRGDETRARYFGKDCRVSARLPPG